MVFIVYLIKKLKDLIKNNNGPIGITYRKVLAMFFETEKEIDKDIDKLIPENKVPNISMKELKEELKEKVHEEIEEEEEKIKDPNRIKNKE